MKAYKDNLTRPSRSIFVIGALIVILGGLLCSTRFSLAQTQDGRPRTVQAAPVKPTPTPVTVKHRQQPTPTPTPTPVSGGKIAPSLGQPPPPPRLRPEPTPTPTPEEFDPNDP